MTVTLFSSFVASVKMVIFINLSFKWIIFLFEVVSSSIDTAAIAQGVAGANTTAITVTAASITTTNLMNFKSLSHFDFIYYNFSIN